MVSFLTWDYLCFNMIVIFLLCSFIVVGDMAGHVKFFDQSLKLVHWFVSFNFISKIVFLYEKNWISLYMYGHFKFRLKKNKKCHSFLSPGIKTSTWDQWHQLVLRFIQILNLCKYAFTKHMEFLTRLQSKNVHVI